MAGIVVGYDGTESSKAALEATIALAKDVGVLGSTPYRLVHTSEKPVLVVPA
jgi:nucleotide-binding universal stress UspA family protein